MKRPFYLAVLLIFIFISCAQHKREDVEKWKKEIIDTEHAFAEMAKTESISRAFLTFSAEDVVLLRNNNLIRGKDELRASYEKRTSSESVSLTWSPDFVDVSSSGDLGYTYGKYIYTAIDSIGNSKTNEGFFHTVWKRQPDGQWKFVWD